MIQVLIDSVSVVLVCDTVQHVRHAGAFQQSVIHQGLGWKCFMLSV